MKRAAILTLAVCLLLPGCSTGQTGEEGTYQVYYSALSDPKAESALAWEPYALPARVEPVPGLVRAMLDEPETTGLTSPFPSGVRLLSWELEEGRLHLDLSEQYGGLTGVDLSVADACLTLTLCQLEGVESVYVTVEGSEIPYRPIQQLTQGRILLEGGAEDPVYVGVELWYPKEDHSGLDGEYRQITVRGEETLPRAVLSAWLEGPRQEALYACMPEGAQVRSASVNDGICTVDLSVEFLTAMPSDQVETLLTVYSIVNTLGELEGVEAVQLLFEGETADFLNGVPLREPLIPDLELTDLT